MRAIIRSHFIEQQSNFLYQILVDEAMIAFTVFDEDSGLCVYMNKLARSLLEIGQPDEIIKTHLNDFDPKDNHERFKSFGKYILAHDGLYQDILVKKTNGMKFIANVGIKHYSINERKLLLIMLQDITLQKKLQRELTLKQTEVQNAYAELLMQNKQLKDLDVAKDRFIALTTHELRTPISAMLGSAEVLKDGLYDTEEQKNEFINMIYEQGTHLMELVNDILDFAKIQAGKMDFYIKQEKIKPIVKKVIEHLKSMAQEESIKVSLADSQDETFLCYFDNVRMTQVISNIMSNAIKYNKKNGQVNIRIEQNDLEVTVYIADTGRGIPKDQYELVFNEFETLGKVANHQKGTGLGMPITKRLIEGMGGSIHLTSEVGKGSTFWVKIPKTKVLPEVNYRERDDTYDLVS